MAGLVIMNIREHFDGISSAYYDIVDRLWYDVGYYHRRESEVLQRVLRWRPRLAIDAGCGPGRHTATLRSCAARVVGIDISRNMLEQAKREASTDRPQRVDFIQADVRQLPFRSGVADFILNFEVLEHLPRAADDVSTTLREIRRVLRSNGAVLIEAPLVRHRLWQKLMRTEGTWKELSHAEVTDFYERRPLNANHRFSEQEIESRLIRAGLRIGKKFHIRVLPARLIERFPFLTGLDRILEGVPLVHALSREAIWLARSSES